MADAKAKADLDAAPEPDAADAQAQAQAATRSGSVVAPAPAAKTKEQEKEAEKLREEAHAVGSHLANLDRKTLEALSHAVDHAMRSKGFEPEQAAPTARELSRGLPINEEATSKLDTAKAVSHLDKELGVKEHDVVAYSVRQSTGAGGQPVGPAYVRVVTADGQKHIAQI